MHKKSSNATEVDDRAKLEVIEKVFMYRNMVIRLISSRQKLANCRMTVKVNFTILYGFHLHVFVTFASKNHGNKKQQTTLRDRGAYWRRIKEKRQQFSSLKSLKRFENI